MGGERETRDHLAGGAAGKLLDLVAARRTSVRTAPARRTKACPIGVRIMPRARRSTSGAPSSRSSSWTLRVSAGWASCKCRAAARKLPRSAIATTSRN
jgi:hypothetical protein